MHTENIQSCTDTQKNHTNKVTMPHTHNRAQAAIYMDSHTDTILGHTGTHRHTRQTHRLKHIFT